MLAVPFLVWQLLIVVVAFCAVLPLSPQNKLKSGGGFHHLLSGGQRHVLCSWIARGRDSRMQKFCDLQEVSTWGIYLSCDVSCGAPSVTTSCPLM